MSRILTLKLLIRNIWSNKFEEFTLCYKRLSENISGCNNMVLLGQILVDRLVFLSASSNFNYDRNNCTRARCLISFYCAICENVTSSDTL